MNKYNINPLIFHIFASQAKVVAMQKITLLLIFFLGSICLGQIAWAHVDTSTIYAQEYAYVENIQSFGKDEQQKNTPNPFSIYPNPATNGYVNIVSKTKGPKDILIFDVLGKEILKTTIDNNKLDISSLRSGIFILKIIQGKHTVTTKLIVK